MLEEEEVCVEGEGGLGVERRRDREGRGEALGSGLGCGSGGKKHARAKTAETLPQTRRPPADRLNFRSPDPGFPLLRASP